MAKASANLYPYVHLVPAAAPSSPAAGSQRIYLDSGDSNKLKRKDSAGTVTTIEGGAGAFTAFASYTPAVTAVTTNPTLGTAAVTEGEWCQTGTGTGALVVAHIYIKFGTSGVAAGSGSYRISLPANASTSMTSRAIGQGMIYDASAGRLENVAVNIVSATTVQLLYNATGSPIIANNVPWTWAATDEISLHLHYKLA